MTNVGCSFVKKKITLYHTATCSLVISLLEKHGNFEVSPLFFTIITVEIELLLPWLRLPGTEIFAKNGLNEPI